jgi:hypothetical protein
MKGATASTCKEAVAPCERSHRLSTLDFGYESANV